MLKSGSSAIGEEEVAARRGRRREVDGVTGTRGSSLRPSTEQRKNTPQPDTPGKKSVFVGRKGFESKKREYPRK